MAVDFPEYSDEIKKLKENIDNLSAQLRQKTSEFYSTVHADFIKSLVGKCFYKVDVDSGKVKYYFKVVSVDGVNAASVKTEQMRVYGTTIELSAGRFISIDFLLDGWDGETFEISSKEYKKIKTEALSLHK